MVHIIMMVIGVTLIVFSKRLGRFENRVESAVLGDSGGRLWDNWNTFLYVLGGSFLIFFSARSLLD